MRILETEQDYADGCASPRAPMRRQVHITVVNCVSDTGHPGVVAEVHDAHTREWIVASGRKRTGVVNGQNESFRARSEARRICRVLGFEVV